MLYYGLSLNSSDLPGNVYVTFILAGLAEYPAYIFATPAMERLGRRWTLVHYPAPSLSTASP